MASLERRLWTAWRLAHLVDYRAFFYDVAIGEGTDPGPKEPDNYRYGFIRLSRLRLDAVGARDTGWDLFEVRPRAGASALGAILTYLAAWKADPPDTRQPSGVLITDQARPEIVPLLQAAGIKLELVTPAQPA